MAKITFTPDQQIDIFQKYKDGKPSTEIAKYYSVSYVTIIKFLRENGIIIRSKPVKKYSYQLLVDDYLSGLSLDEVAVKNLTSIGTVFRALKINNITTRPRPSGKDHPLWRGGAYKDLDNYVILSSEDNKRFHRELMKSLIGRELESWECVHHVNHNKSDNNIENLVIMPMREHTRFHNFLRVRGIEISRNSLELYAIKENDLYYRFTKKDFEKHANIDKIPKPPKKRKKCQEDGCNNKRYGNQKICNKHYQRKRAKERGYWISGGGRKAIFKLDI